MLYGDDPDRRVGLDDRLASLEERMSTFDHRLNELLVAVRRVQDVVARLVTLVPARLAVQQRDATVRVVKDLALCGIDAKLTYKRDKRVYLGIATGPIPDGWNGGGRRYWPLSLDPNDVYGEDGR